MRTLELPRSSLRLAVQPYAAAIHYAALAGIILAGAWLRLTGLRRQSLWFDEIDVVVRAQRPFGDVLRTVTTPGENGPLYNVLLALWIQVAGISEIAVRFPSAVAGTLAIPLLYLLARRLGGTTTALLAAGLLAISPYHVWYSQEAKMYALIVLLALLSSLSFVEALERNQPLWWAAYVVVTTMLFYSHVVSVLVFVAQSLYALSTHRSWPGRERRWLIAAGVLTLPYIPIALWALDVVSGRAYSWQPDVGLWQLTRILATRFAVLRADAVVENRGALLYGALALGGIAALAARRGRRHAWLLAMLLAIVPPLGLYLASLRQSVFQDRYAIVALPAYLLLVAAALAWLLRGRATWPLGVASVFLLLAFAWGPLRDVNRSTAAQKEDWRSAYALVADRVQPGDVYVIIPGYMTTALRYFNQRDPRLHGHNVATVPNVRDTDTTREELVASLQRQIGDATRLWLIKSPDRADPEDPERYLEGWLEEHGEVEFERVLNGAVVRLYVLRR
jgi:uncharacterized membrane protein